MKKTLLSMVAVIAVTSLSFAQGLNINLDGTATDISGTTQVAPEITSDVMNHHLLDFIVNNETSSNQDWKITRLILNQTAGWSNYLCWGPTPGIGLCYPVSTDLQWSSGSESIPVNGAGKLQTYVSAPTGGSATYRYYVSTDGVTFLDSIDVQVNSVLGLNEKPSLTVSVIPNPANSYVSVSTHGVNTATVTLVDVLGNVVLKETMNDSKTIPVADYKNGIYFLRIDSEDQKAVTRKLIVRH
jgi:hypothetical protein